MQLWRISDFADLSGAGSERYSARWHTKGLPVVYLAASPAGALIEVVVHLEVGEEDDDVPQQYQLLEIFSPDTLLPEDLQPLPTENDWRLHEGLTRPIGDEWLSSRRSALARVPSAILPSTWNYLLNPVHPDAPSIEIVSSISARFDARLFRKMRD